ncbi:MAG: phytoene desaturase [Hamadaea sp.]|uniref:phytoene desaturase family protein n=1 Tax=Hamadaea sp. TaxID=2024425 RepID=UPI0017AA6EFE|nr:phytoene desaturase family protein [Hamadaea sp.]NUR74602.1 phytoene desaturase [Hamadaea sp.]NUT17618.1 phytoene desaturase [Hamadaea sp.]
MRTISGQTNRVIIVGAGLGGLACALHLAGAGRDVTVIERAGQPGGRAGRLELDGYRFDLGPTVLTAPDLLAEPMAAVGENLDDWLDLIPLDPAYRAHYPDGSTLDVTADQDRMEQAVAELCGAREAAGYRRFVSWAERLWRLERRDFIDRNLDSPRDLLTANLIKLALTGGFRRLGPKISQFFADSRTRRIFSFQALYAGLAPDHALALYAVISYLDTVAGVYHPRGGMHAVPQALADIAVKHGVTFRYDTTVTGVETRGDRAVAVHTADGERIAADVIVLNPDLAAAFSLLPTPAPARLERLRPSPSCVVLHLGARAHYPGIAHHNLHFGRAWERTFEEVIDRGELMTDPSLLVTNPTKTDDSAAPPGRQSYYVLAPVPNLSVAPVTWTTAMSRRYAGELMATLEQRGYYDLGLQLEISHVVTPADWARDGHVAGSPFSYAHTFAQTGPFRPGNLHPSLSNVVFTGSGTQPGVGVPMVLISGKLAARRITGDLA